jgi:hypothetical protein
VATWSEVEQDLEGVEGQPRQEEDGRDEHDQDAHLFAPEVQQPNFVSNDRICIE